MKKWAIAIVAVLVLAIVVLPSLGKNRESTSISPSPQPGSATISASPTVPPASSSAETMSSSAAPASSSAKVATPSATTAVRSSASNRGPCTVAQATMLGTGVSPAWSPDNSLLVYYDNDSNGIYQVYTMRPDGSNKTCLTCIAVPGGPPVNRHKANAVWDPTGRYIMLQVEMNDNPLAPLDKNKAVAGLILSGVWMNLYVTTPDGKHWYKLTDYSSKQTDGALSPLISTDGKKVLWSRIVAPASKDHPFGTWRLLMADFMIAGGVPSLQHIQDITPPGATFIESHGFAPDGSSVIFTSDIDNTNAFGMDIFTMDLATRAVHNLTSSPAWDEHAYFTPDGKKISYMSSSPYPHDLLKTELMTMNPDGSGKMQLTHFNVPGYPESTADQGMPTRALWDSTGTRLAVTYQLAKGYPASSIQMWLLTFAGACGA